MKMVKLTSPLAILFALVLAPPLNAGPSVGRYADGTPYRIDAEGNEIVDQLAELELEKQNSQFRIQALEKDLEEKEIALQQRRSNQPEPQLYGEEKTASAAVSVAAVAAAAETARNSTRLKKDLEAAESARLQLQRKLKALESETVPEQQFIANSRRKELEIGQLKDKLALYSKELEKNKEVIKGQQRKSEVLNEELEKSKESVKGQQRKSEVLGEEFEKSKESVKSEQQRILDQQQKVMYALQKNLERAKFENGVLSKKVQTQKILEAKQAQTHDVNFEPIKARYNFSSALKTESIRGDSEPKPKLDHGMLAQAQRYVTEIDGSMALRDRLFTEYNKKPELVVSFKPRELKAPNGESLATLRTKLHRVTTQGDLTRAMSGLRSILMLVKDDIALVKRLDK